MEGEAKASPSILYYYLSSIKEYDTVVDLSTFDAHIERYEMGQAYKAITASMGPSPQLVAFINYDKVTEDSVGLESFNIMDQHEAILAEIDSDPSLSMATEALADRIRKISDFVMKGGAVVWAASLIGGPLGGIGFSAMIAGAIVKKISGIPTKVYPYSAFEGAKALVEKVVAKEVEIVNKIPNNFSPDSWELFVRKCQDEKPVIYRVIPDNEKVPVDRSGWSETNIVAATKWLKMYAEKVELLQKSFAPKIDKIEKWVVKDHAGDEEALKAMKFVSKATNLIGDPFEHSVRFLGSIKETIDNAAHLFEESNK